MKDYPKGGLIGKALILYCRIRDMQIPLYAANASFFLILSIFPALLLFVGVLQYTPLAVEDLGLMLDGILPDAFLAGAENLIRSTYDAATGVTLGITAVTTLWSASRGLYGMLTGLNAIYAVEESRGYLRTRFISMGYTFLFYVVILLTLALHVFGSGVLAILRQATHPALQKLLDWVDFRFFLLLFLQITMFAAMFMALPNGKRSYWAGLPGALIASMGWLIFSDIFSVYVENFAHWGNVYGSLCLLPLSMLWLYCCMMILFFGGGINALLAENDS